MKDSFNPSQLGVGVPGGCEAAVHATRRFLTNMPDNFVVVKIDFSNASVGIQSWQQCLHLYQRFIVSVI